MICAWYRARTVRADVDRGPWSKEADGSPLASHVRVCVCERERGGGGGECVCRFLCWCECAGVLHIIMYTPIASCVCVLGGGGSLCPSFLLSMSLGFVQIVPLHLESC